MNPAAHRIAALTMAVTLLATLGACSRYNPDKPAKPAAVADAGAAAADAPKAATGSAAQGTDHAALMQAVYGKGYRADKKNALADLPDPDRRGSTARMVITPVTSLKLASGEVVLVVNGETANAQGEGDAGHANPGLISFYLLREADGAWQVVQRQENVDATGSHGSIGAASWAKLPNGKPVLAVLGGYSGQGYSVTQLNLYDPTAVQIRNLVKEAILVASDSEGACTEDSMHCWDVKANWHFAPTTSSAKYDDLVLVFSGYDEERPVAPKPKPDEEQEDGEAAEGDAKPEPAPTKPAARVRKKIGGAARYVFDKTGYRLMSGDNPVPTP